MLGSTKLILLSNGARSDHCFPLSETESYQFPGFPVCKEERALGLLRPQLWPMPLVIKMLGELSKADTSLIASRLLYFYKNVHAVQSGCLDHKKLPSRNLHVVILAFEDTYLVLVVVLLMLIMMLMLMLMILLK